MIGTVKAENYDYPNPRALTTEIHFLDENHIIYAGNTGINVNIKRDFDTNEYLYNLHFMPHGRTTAPDTVEQRWQNLRLYSAGLLSLLKYVGQNKDKELSINNKSFPCPKTLICEDTTQGFHDINQGIFRGTPYFTSQTVKVSDVKSIYNFTIDIKAASQDQELMARLAKRAAELNTEDLQITYPDLRPARKAA